MNQSTHSRLLHVAINKAGIKDIAGIQLSVFYRAIAAPVISPAEPLSLDGKNSGCHQRNDGQCFKHLL